MLGKGARQRQEMGEGAAPSLASRKDGQTEDGGRGGAWEGRRNAEIVAE